VIRRARTIFLVADLPVLTRLRDATRTALAWQSIVDDIEEVKLVADQLQKKQAEKELTSANAVLPKAARECFKWLLCPVQDDATATKPNVEPFPLNTTSGTASGELERVCKENELVIEAWSPIHLRAKLNDLYWKGGKVAVGAAAFWEDSLKYLYLPRLKTRDVLAAVIRTGAASRDFFGTAYGQADGKYDGFRFGDGDVSFDGTLLLIEAEAAKQYALKIKAIIEAKPPEAGATHDPSKPATETGTGTPTSGTGTGGKPTGPGPTVTPAKAKSFHGSVEVPATLAKSKLNTIAEEVIKLLANDPNATIRITLEIAADFPHGASDTIKRGVSENATSLGFKVNDWE